MCDFFYVDNVYGVFWDKVYEWYVFWIDYVCYCMDFNYVVDIMSGEVVIGYFYVSGGDMFDIDCVFGGLLGCDLEEVNGCYCIVKIYIGEQWNLEVYVLLYQLGLEVCEGDYLLMINGQEFCVLDNLY